MKRIVVSRRQVLRGAGGFSLALPFLPSLVPGRAFGATAVIARQPRLVAMASNHGGIREATMYPNDAVLDQSKQVYTDHTIRWGKLKPTTDSGNTVVSGIARASSGKLTPALVDKMNIIRGLDVPWYLAHNTGGHLGNYARNDGNGSDGKAVQGLPTPTIDQLLAYSTKFYPSTQGIRERAMITGVLNGVSYNFTNPTARTGGIQEIRGTGSPKDLFTKIFDPTNPGGITTPSAPPRQPIVDRVLTNYKSLKESNRRLSADDRTRLDAHMQRLSELEMRVGARPVQRSASCKEQTSPGEVTGRARYQALNDVIAAAFICGTSRIAVMGIRENEFAANGANWHQGVAHQWDGAGQTRLVEANRNVFSEVFVDLMAKLDVEEQPGQTILDNSFLMWTNECGEETHDSRSRPTFTAGGGAGAFQTGLYIDYRNMSAKGRVMQYGKVKGNSGLTHSQFLATVLQAYGMPPSDWQNIPNNGRAGYGNDFIADIYKTAYVPQVMSNASALLPVLTTP